MTKNSKRSIVVSAALVIAMCLSIMAAGTYAWFTDTATANVNKIVSGNLDVALYMQNDNNGWDSAEGKTVCFLKNNGETSTAVTDSEQILWEPGGTYETQKLKVVNEGNLALKFKIVVSNIDGNNKLNEVITWLVCDKNGTYADGVSEPTVSLDTMEAILVAPSGDSNDNAYYFSLKGHMDENAGNEYKNLSIDNIAITIYATQASEEYDSFNNTYDEKATYSANITEKITVETTKSENNVVTVSKKKTYNSANTLKVDGKTVSAATVTIPEGVVVNSENATLTLTVKEEDSVDEKVTIKDGTTAKSYDIKVDGVKSGNDGNTTPLTVTFYVGKGLSDPVVYHGADKMTAVTAGNDGTNNTYSYNSETGMMTIYTATFSSFTVVHSVYQFTNGTVASVVGTVTGSGSDATISALGGSVITVNANVTAVLNSNSSGKKFAMAVWAKGKGSKVTITGGTYQQSGEFITEYNTTNVPDPYDLIYASEGAEIVITGGTFKCAMPRWTLNCKDSLDPAKITVSGGSFYKFNPAFTAVNDQLISVADGYVVLKVSDDWYEVVSKDDTRLAYATEYKGTRGGTDHGSHWYVMNGVDAELEAYYSETYLNSYKYEIAKVTAD